MAADLPMNKMPKSFAEAPLTVHIICGLFNKGVPLHLLCPGHQGWVEKISCCSVDSPHAHLEVKYRSEFAHGSVMIYYYNADERVTLKKYAFGGMLISLPD